MNEQQMCLSKIPVSSLDFSFPVKYIHVDPSIPCFKQDPFDAGMDLYLSEDSWIFPFFVRKLKLNIKIELPYTFYGRVAGRSGISNKRDIVIHATIDPGYRGQLHAQMYRVGWFPKKLRKGTRVCQLIIQPYVHALMLLSTELSQSKRGTSGFGSSGEE